MPPKKSTKAAGKMPVPKATPTISRTRKHSTASQSGRVNTRSTRSNKNEELVALTDEPRRRTRSASRASRASSVASSVAPSVITVDEHLPAVEEEEDEVQLINQQLEFHHSPSPIHEQEAVVKAHTPEQQFDLSRSSSPPQPETPQQSDTGSVIRHLSTPSPQKEEEEEDIVIQEPADHQVNGRHSSSPEQQEQLPVIASQAERKGEATQSPSPIDAGKQSAATDRRAEPQVPIQLSSSPLLPSSPSQRQRIVRHSPDGIESQAVVQLSSSPSQRSSPKQRGSSPKQRVETRPSSSPVQQEQENAYIDLQPAKPTLQIANIEYDTEEDEEPASPDYNLFTIPSDPAAPVDESLIIPSSWHPTTRPKQNVPYTPRGAMHEILAGQPITPIVSKLTTSTTKGIFANMRNKINVLETQLEEAKAASPETRRQIDNKPFLGSDDQTSSPGYYSIMDTKPTAQPINRNSLRYRFALQRETKDEEEETGREDTHNEDQDEPAMVIQRSTPTSARKAPQTPPGASPDSGVATPASIFRLPSFFTKLLGYGTPSTPQQNGSNMAQKVQPHSQGKLNFLLGRSSATTAQQEQSDALKRAQQQSQNKLNHRIQKKTTPSRPSSSQSQSASKATTSRRSHKATPATERLVRHMNIENIENVPPTPNDRVNGHSQPQARTEPRPRTNRFDVPDEADFPSIPNTPTPADKGPVEETPTRRTRRRGQLPGQVPRTPRNNPTPKSKPVEPNADKRALLLEQAAERKRIQEQADKIEQEKREAEKKSRQEEVARQKVGAKRKRVKIDDLESIPARLPGQSSGVFSFRPELFSYDSDDDEIELLEEEIQYKQSPPSKRIRTDHNVFTPQPEPETTVTHTPAPSTPLHNATEDAIERQRQQATQYKPRQPSRLSHVSHNVLWTPAALSDISEATEPETPAPHRAPFASTAARAVPPTPATPAATSPARGSTSRYVFPAPTPLPFVTPEVQAYWDANFDWPTEERINEIVSGCRSAIAASN